MKIIQYILYNSSGSPTPPIHDSTINIGLILGICIPILIISNYSYNLVIVIIIILVYKRYKSNNDLSSDIKLNNYR